MRYKLKKQIWLKFTKITNVIGILWKPIRGIFLFKNWKCPNWIKMHLKKKAWAGWVDRGIDTATLWKVRLSLFHIRPAALRLQKTRFLPADFPRHHGTTEAVWGVVERKYTRWCPGNRWQQIWQICTQINLPPHHPQAEEEPHPGPPPPAADYFFPSPAK